MYFLCLIIVFGETTYLFNYFGKKKTGTQTYFTQQLYMSLVQFYSIEEVYVQVIIKWIQQTTIHAKE